jgi:predicted alpha/beta hydrolase
MCTCNAPTCLGPDPDRPTVRHRRLATVVAVDRKLTYPLVYVAIDDDDTTPRALRIGYQIKHADARSGIKGYLEYITTGHSGLDYFRALTPHELHDAQARR